MVQPEDGRYSTSQKKVPVPFLYNGGSTVLCLEKDSKTLHEQYGCIFTERFTTCLYDEAFSSTVYVLQNVHSSSVGCVLFMVGSSKLKQQ